MHIIFKASSKQDCLGLRRKLSQHPPSFHPVRVGDQGLGKRPHIFPKVMPVKIADASVSSGKHRVLYHCQADTAVITMSLGGMLCVEVSLDRPS